MKKLFILLSLAVVAAATAAVPLAASGGERSKLAIGVRITFTSPTHASGTFASCCAVNDKGTAEADVTSFTPGKNDTATFEATETFVSPDGTLVLALRGVTGPLSSPRHIAKGHWSVTSASGAYAGLTGEGSFTALTDETTGELTAVNQGEVHAR